MYPGHWMDQKEIRLISMFGMCMDTTGSIGIKLMPTIRLTLTANSSSVNIRLRTGLNLYRNVTSFQEVAHGQGLPIKANMPGPNWPAKENCGIWFTSQPSGIGEQRLNGVSKWENGLCMLSLIHISEPTRLGMISYAVFC